jgi:hypothetical protein
VENLEGELNLANINHQVAKKEEDEARHAQYKQDRITNSVTPSTTLYYPRCGFHYYSQLCIGLSSAASSRFDYALSATSFIRAGWSWLSSMSESKDPSDAKVAAAAREVQRKRDEAEKCRRRIVNANAHLQGLNLQKLQMVGIANLLVDSRLLTEAVQDEFAKALAEALWALQFIGAQAIALMTQFNQMTENISEFATIHRPRLDDVARGAPEENSSLIEV